MLTSELRLTLFILLSFVFAAQAKKEKVDEIVLVQEKISLAYEKGYVDAAPIEMGLVEEKVVEARMARDKRKKRRFAQLIEQINADLGIIKQRYEVNLLHQKLANFQQQNTDSRKMLDELKEQLK